MNQTLKISIARGGCRFASPLYLGSRYVISFSGERSEEAKKVLFVKPRSQNPDDTDGIVGLAESFVGTDGITLSLDKNALVEWFKSNRACDVDSYVDAHCYVFNENGDVLADSPVSIEYKPIDFVIDNTEFSRYSALIGRIVALEEKRISDKAKIDANEAGISELAEANEEMREQTARDIAESAKNTLIASKAYADLLRQMVAKFEYIRDAEASTEDLDRYRKVEARTKVVDGKQEIVLSISEELYTLEGGEADANRYVYNDTSNTFGGDGTTNTFNTMVVLNGITSLTITPSADDDSKKVVNTEWVNAKIVASLIAHREVPNTWADVQTFLNGIVADVTGDVVGNVNGNVIGDVKGDLTGSVSVPEGKILDVAGESTFSGEVTLANVKTDAPTGFIKDDKTTQGVNKEYLWEMFKKWGNYFDGYWRIAFHHSEPVQDGKDDGRIVPNTAQTANFTTWKKHMNQAGVLLPDTEVLEPFAFYSAGGLIKFHAPNVMELGERSLDSCDEMLEVYMPNLKKVGTWALSSLTRLPNDMFNFIAQRIEHIETGGMAHASLWEYVSLPLLRCGEMGCLYGSRTAVKQVSIGTGIPDDWLGTNVDDLRPALHGIWDTYKDTVMDTQVSGSSELTAKLEELYPNLKEEFTFCEPRLGECASLTSVAMPKTQIVGDACFKQCTNLTSINVEEAVFIGSNAFAGTCYNAFTGKSLGLLKIPKCLMIGNNAFKSLSSSYWTLAPDWVRADVCEYINAGVFYRCRYLKGFYAPNMKYIGLNAFAYCPELTGSYYEEDGVVTGETNTLNLPECLRIGQGGFSYCTQLTKINIPKCNELLSNAFTGSTAITDIYLYGYDFDALIAGASTWGLSTTTYTFNPADNTHTGVAIHATYTDGRRCIVGFSSSAWRFQHYED